MIELNHNFAIEIIIVRWNLPAFDFRRARIKMAKMQSSGHINVSPIYITKLWIKTFFTIRV